jgi:hypothetical protein
MNKRTILALSIMTVACIGSFGILTVNKYNEVKMAEATITLCDGGVHIGANGEIKDEMLLCVDR